MTNEKQQSYTAVSLLLGSLHGAALAAGLLENACSSGSEDTLHREVIRELARDLKGELEVLAARAEQVTSAAGVEVVEGALRAADVANLAASALSRARTLEAAAATHLAAGAARALSTLAGAAAKDLPDAEYARNAQKDVRGAAWRARLAAGQVNELLEEIG